MFTVNFELVDGYFYNNQEVLFPQVKDEIKYGAKVVTVVYKNTLIKENISRLLEHPTFTPLLKPKAKLTQIFINTGSDAAKTELETFMEKMRDVLTSCLETIHRLYWLRPDEEDVSKNLRSQYSFEECLNNAISIAKIKMEILNLISNEQNLPSIQSALINREIENNNKKNSKKLGGKGESSIKRSVGK